MALIYSLSPGQMAHLEISSVLSPFFNFQRHHLLAGDFSTLSQSKTLRSKFGQPKFCLLMVLDLSEALYRQETLVQGINCLKVDLLFLDYHKEVTHLNSFLWISGQIFPHLKMLGHHFKSFLSENVRSGLLLKGN